jgi:hypothetical protein
MMRFDKNARIAWTLVAVVGGMLGMAYAAVPLYELFCKATGFGGTPIVVQEGERPVLSRTVTVRFAETLRGSLRGLVELAERLARRVRVGLPAEFRSGRGRVGVKHFLLDHPHASPH